MSYPMAAPQSGSHSELQEVTAATTHKGVKSDNNCSSEGLHQHNIAAGLVHLRVENGSAVRRDGDAVIEDVYFAKGGNLFHLRVRKVQKLISAPLSPTRIKKVNPIVTHPQRANVL